MATGCVAREVEAGRPMMGLGFDTHGSPTPAQAAGGNGLWEIMIGNGVILSPGQVLSQALQFGHVACQVG